MDRQNLDNLEDVHAKLSILQDLVYIVIDFIENEYPAKQEKNTDEFNWRAVCFAKRSRMFSHSLDAAYFMLMDIDKKLEEIIGNEIKNRKDN